MLIASALFSGRILIDRWRPWASTGARAESGCWDLGYYKLGPWCLDRPRQEHPAQSMGSSLVFEDRRTQVGLRQDANF